VLRRPNRYQNHIQFKEWWTTSKLIRGNTYVLKVRDGRGVVRALYILDPSRVQVLVAPDGSVYYQLGDDNLTGLQTNGVQLPATEIIHDRMNCLFHPLVGISPLFASGLAANIGLNIERNSAGFFGNSSNPGGILIAPSRIDQATADKIKDMFHASFTGKNSGKIAVVGDNMKFQQLRMTAVESQLIEQLKWTAEVVCSTFHVPPFKIAVGPMPTYQNGEILDQRYYSDCLQYHIESFEAALDEGLGLEVKIDGRMLGVELDLTGLLRMDTQTQVNTLKEGVAGSIFTTNEARRQFDLEPVDGGDSIRSQQQYYDIAALAERDRTNPFPEPTPPATPPPTDSADSVKSLDDGSVAEMAVKFAQNLRAA
jgi:HK97 family phage portal protein